LDSESSPAVGGKRIGGGNRGSQLSERASRLNRGTNPACKELRQLLEREKRWPVGGGGRGNTSDRSKPTSQTPWPKRHSCEKNDQGAEGLKDKRRVTLGDYKR